MDKLNIKMLRQFCILWWAISFFLTIKVSSASSGKMTLVQLEKSGNLYRIAEKNQPTIYSRTSRSLDTENKTDHPDFCYYFSTIKTGRNDAVERCAFDDLDLVSFETESEYLYVLQYISQLKEGLYWTSGGDLCDEKRFAWFTPDGPKLIKWPGPGIKKYRCTDERGVNTNRRDCIAIAFWNEHEHCWAIEECNAVQAFWICKSRNPTCIEVGTKLQVKENSRFKSVWTPRRDSSGSCYHFSRYEVTRQEAKQACMQFGGGDLVSIESELEENLVESILNEEVGTNVKYWTSGVNKYPGSIKSYWTWESTGKMLGNFKKWGQLEVNGGDDGGPTREDKACMTIFKEDGQYSWKGYPCLAAIGFFICEKSQVSSC